ncbi:MAG: hypothetical protein E7661_01075 [Ruminococcaceae bacterium]|nr:hypothetical protein [Oscillospiraceae bacterium]
MKKYQKVLMIVLLCLSILIIGFIASFETLFSEYATYTAFLDWSVEEIYEFYWKYDDEWIIGKTADEIQDEYGTFDSGNQTVGQESFSASYIILERSELGGDYTLIISFENNIAVKVKRIFRI